MYYTLNISSIINIGECDSYIYIAMLVNRRCTVTVKVNIGGDISWTYLYLDFKACSCVDRINKVFVNLNLD